jgi:hypothetical protein
MPPEAIALACTGSLCIALLSNATATLCAQTSNDHTAVAGVMAGAQHASATSGRPVMGRGILHHRITGTLRNPLSCILQASSWQQQQQQQSGTRQQPRAAEPLWLHGRRRWWQHPAAAAWCIGHGCGPEAELQGPAGTAAYRLLWQCSMVSVARGLLPH